jgi:endonuclease YncB( thermonuclease family)
LKENRALINKFNLVAQMQISLKNYQKLLLQIQRTIKQTEQNIVTTVNHEKVVMSWEIGKIIDQHLLENSEKSYGKKLFLQLEKDTAVKQKVLYQMHSFYKTYPTLPKAKKDLSWSHYRNLIAVKNDEKRQYLEQLTIENNLGTDQLQRQISKANARKRNYASSKKVTKISCQRGQLFTYKIVTLPNSAATFVDCGFSIFSEIKTSLKGDDSVVASTKKGEAFLLKKSAIKRQKLHTYKAFLDKVVDGDTLHVTLDLGFKIRHKEILRLAKINAPEAKTLEGKKSFEGLKEILKEVPFLIVKTNKTDIYGRFVADVFLGEKGEKNEQKIAEEGVYLNQHLLDLGLAEIF